MKKFISILLAMIIAMASVSAFAEATAMEGEFSIRNGIKFGMTIDEVEKIETGINSLSPGNREYAENKDTMSYYVDSIAGINLVRAASDTIEYSFCKETGELEAVSYWFGYDIAREYDSLKSAYQSKYGMPIHENDGHLFDITPPVLESSMTGFYSQVYDLTAYCEWLVKYEDCYVVLDIFTLDNNQMYAEYMRITNEEMEQLAVDNSAKKEQRNSDI